MSYFKTLGLNAEPFSTSPDPAFFYRSQAHQTVLQRLEISIRLKRGLCMVLGDVGIGKTTMSRLLLQRFSDEDEYVFYLIMNPRYKSEYQFLLALVKMFKIPDAGRSTLDFREAIEKYLFFQGVEEGKTIVLLIDEGQELTPTMLECLRMLLNYETNEYKLLQLIIVGQLELLPKVKRIRNFVDRIDLKYIINPLDLEETKSLIKYRLSVAGYYKETPLFSDDGLEAIFSHTQGYPRKISFLCHRALEMLSVNGSRVVDSELIYKILKKEEPWNA